MGALPEIPADETIPGLAVPIVRGANPLLAAIETTITALRDAGHVDPVTDAARIELCRELAHVMSDKRRTGRTASVGNDARVLMELLTGFIDAAAALEGDAMLRDAMADWSAQVAKLTEVNP
jgi:hypothetical protein